MQESSITDAGMIIDVRCWKTAAVFNFMSLYFCPKRKIRNNRRPSAQIPLLNCLHPCCRWGHLIIYHLWSCFDGRTRPHHQFCQCVTSLREFSMKRSELSSSNCCCMSRPYSRAQHGVLTPAASINAHTVCLRTINMLLARSSCFSSYTYKHWHCTTPVFPVGCQLNFGERRRFTEETEQKTSLTADQRGKSTQMSNFYAQTQRPLDSFFFSRSLPSTNVPIQEFDKEPNSGATSPSFQLRPSFSTPIAHNRASPIEITVRTGIC